MRNESQDKVLKRNVSSKITDMASKLENKIKKTKTFIDNEDDNKKEIEEKLNSVDIIYKKPVSYNKKKKKKIEFFDNYKNILFFKVLFII